MSLKKTIKQLIKKQGVKLLKEKGLPIIKKELAKRKGKK